MMLDHLGQSVAATALLGAIEDVVRDGRSRTPDLGGQATTSQVTDAIIARLGDAPG